MFEGLRAGLGDDFSRLGMQFIVIAYVNNGRECFWFLMCYLPNHYR